jgi:competence protein ComEC
MRPPILFLTIGFAVGLVLGEGGRGAGDGYIVVPVLLAGAWLARRAPVGAAVGIMGVAGILWGGAAVRERGSGCRAAIVRLLDPVPDGGGVVDADVVGGAQCRGPVRLRWPEHPAAAGGTTWVVAGRWVALGEGRGLLVARRVKLLDATPRGRGALRDRVVTRAQALFGSRAALVEAMVIARRTELDPAVRERYARAGLAHLLAIAGLHVGFLAGWAGACLGLLGIRGPGRLWATSVALVGYVWLLGFPAPATRAAVMFLLHAVARWRERVVAPRGLLAVTALILLLADPWAIQSVGAWLSLSAVGAVIWAGRAAAGLPRLARLVAPTIAATLVTAPITALAFGTVAPVGVLTNLVAIPLASVAMPGLVLALVTSWIVPPLAALLAAGSGLGLALIDGVATAGAWVPGGHVVMVAGWQAALMWLGVAVVAWWLWNSPRRRWVVTGRIAFVAGVVGWISVAAHLTPSLDACRCLTVHFLDVGQGDAAVLRTPAGRWIVIDGGPRTPEGDAGRRVVIPFLRRAGAAAVTLVVASHGDADHLGGIPAIIEAFHPQLVLEPGEPLGRPLYLEFLATVEASGAGYRAARAGDRIALDGVTVDVLSPDSALVAFPLDVNDHGVVVRVTYGDVRLLFQGDAGLAVEAHLAGHAGPVELLKVGHHGSRTATSDEWLTELQPRAAVISVGRHNHYGHPAPEVVARLAQHGIAIFRTDRDGTITFKTNGTRENTAISRQH